MLGLAKIVLELLLKRESFASLLDNSANLSLDSLLLLISLDFSLILKILDLRFFETLTISIIFLSITMLLGLAKNALSIPFLFDEK